MTYFAFGDLHLQPRVLLVGRLNRDLNGSVSTEQTYISQQFNSWTKRYPYFIPSMRGPRRSSSILDRPTYKTTILVSEMGHYRALSSREWTHIATNKSAVNTRDLGLRVLHRARVVTVIREQQQSLRVEIQTALDMQTRLEESTRQQ